MVKRPKAHVLEEESEQALKAMVPSEWILRDMKPDYGLDKELTIVEGEDVTNKVVWLQLKATESLKPKQRTVSRTIETKHLKHWETCRLPVIVLYWIKSKNEFYYLFAQRYIKETLSLTKPEWRNRKSVSVKFPLPAKLADAEALRAIATEGYLYVVEQELRTVQRLSKHHMDLYSKQPARSPIILNEALAKESADFAWIRDFFENPALKEIMRYFQSIKETQIESFQRKLEQFGLISINEILEYFYKQWTVIKKFKEMVQSGNVKEDSIRDLVARNLWLIDPALEDFQVNTTIRKAFAGKLTKVLRKYGNLRPDVICLVGTSSDLVLLEFKRPGVKISFDEYAQVLRYTSIISQLCSDHRLKKCYIIGSDLEHAISMDKIVLGETTIQPLSYVSISTELDRKHSRLIELLQRKMEGGDSR